MNDLANLLPLVLLLVVAYLLIIRPARKRARDVSQLQAQLGVGSRVMLNGGLFGTVVRLADTEVALEIAPGVVVDVHRRGIAKIMPADTSDDSESVAADSADDTPGPPVTTDDGRDDNRGAS